MLRTYWLALVCASSVCRGGAAGADDAGIPGGDAMANHDARKWLLMLMSPETRVRSSGVACALLGVVGLRLGD